MKNNCSKSSSGKNKVKVEIQSSEISGKRKSKGQFEIIVGCNIAKLRKSRNIPLKHLACELNVSVATCCQWELGNRFPSEKNIAAIARFFSCPAKCLLCSHLNTSQCTAVVLKSLLKVKKREL